ncbi:glycosyl transferase family 21-domain-containing protein [Phellopilus nigrolimitatus]|nr:glycosyl transferase family 21-domain-containing protein [Phellopilus nigrolimitatus]
MNIDDDGDVSRRPLILTALAVIALVWYCILWTISILGCLTGRKHLRLRPRSPLSSAPKENVPGVSVLRPLKGLDTNLFENLESTFTQEYSNFEILLSVADADDQALSVVRSLLEKYPQVDAKVVIGEEVVGVNPKVNNLIPAYKQAKNDILWILDSNVLVTPGTLARSVDSLVGPPASAEKSKSNKHRIGLVHHVPFAFVSEQAFGSRIEEAFLNTNHAKMYLAINRVAIESCVVGKSCMYRRSDLERVTGDLKPEQHAAPDVISNSGAPLPVDGRERGLAAFGRFLAEDNMIASALWHELGLRHALGCDVAGNAVGNMPISAYVQRRVRWIRVRKHMVAVATLVEPFTECVMLSIIAAWAAHRLWGVPRWLVLLLHYPAWIALDLDVYDSLAGFYLPVEKRWSFLIAWAMRELLALPIWFLGMVGSEVEWRGKRYRILRNGETARAAPNGSWWSFLSRRKKRDGYEQLEQEGVALNEQ